MSSQSLQLIEAFRIGSIRKWIRLRNSLVHPNIWARRFKIGTLPGGSQVFQWRTSVLERRCCISAINSEAGSPE